MPTLEALISGSEHSELAEELIPRLYNPAQNRREGAPGLSDTTVSLCFFRAHLPGAGTDSTLEDFGALTPADFDGIMLPGLIRAGYDAGILDYIAPSGGRRFGVVETRSSGGSVKQYPINGIGELIQGHIARSNDGIAEMLALSELEVCADATISQRRMQVAKAIGEKIHEGVIRKNGRPYTSHTQEVASLALLAATRVREKHGTELMPKEHVERLVIIGFLHDTLEDQRVSADHYTRVDYTKDPIFTPRALREIMIHYRMPKSDAMYLANSLRLITHDDFDKLSLTFPEYLTRGCSNRYVVGIKLADMLHNLTMDPKPKPELKGFTQQERAASRNKQKHWDEHRAEYHRYLYEGDYEELPNMKHAFFWDSSCKRWGAPLLNELRSMARPDSPPSSVPAEFRYQTNVGGAEFMEQQMPAAVALLEEFTNTSS